ncbi:SGNH/GDSL hydrolase family protein [Chitinophaga lutea]
MRYLILLLLPFSCAFGQDKQARFTDARSLMIVGKGLPTNPVYQRLDSTQSRRLPKSVQYLATHSAGIAVLFETNSPYIRAKWSLKGHKYYANMTPIVHSGLDLYAQKDGKWQWVGVGRPSEKDTVFEQALIENMDAEKRQYMLYLPAYNELTSLEIGVAPEATLAAPAKAAVDTTKRVVMYGSSILHGASASRAGMLYSSMLGRKTGWNMINLGFSGSGKMEFPVAELLATMPASVFVLDCIPNPSPAEIRERAYPFIKHLLTKRPEVPILLIETVIRQNGYWDKKIGATTVEKNQEIRKVYEKLKAEGYKQLLYLPADNLIGSDHEGTVDGVHLTDLGFMRQAEQVLPLLEKLMKKSGAGK